MRPLTFIFLGTAVALIICGLLLLIVHAYTPDFTSLQLPTK